MKIKKVKRLTIPEKIWGRATEKKNVPGTLRDSVTGKQCCLGVYLTACGYQNNDLNEAGLCPRGHHFFAPSVFWSNSLPKQPKDQWSIIQGLTQINDMKMKLPKRKKLIIECFKKLGVTVRFKS